MNQPSRRRLLKSGAVSLILPPLVGDRSIAAELPTRTEPPANQAVRSMVLVGVPLGIHTPYLFPEQAGRGYTPPRYLASLTQEQRKLLTIISGLENRDVDGGHKAAGCLLTGAPHPGRSGFRNTISVDQFAAEAIGGRTRLPYLTIAAGRSGLSISRNGVALPSHSSPPDLFDLLFLDGSKKDKKAQLERVQDGQSILDVVGEQLNALVRKTGSRDSRTIDQFASSVREFENRLVQNERWALADKPVVEAKRPSKLDDPGKFHRWYEQMYDLAALALQTDSTRLITIAGPGSSSTVALPGINQGWHGLSHHGKEPEKLEQLAMIEQIELKLFAEFVEKLKGLSDPAGNLLDRTVLMFASSLGNASSHSNRNLPVIAAGGGLNHGQHLAFDPDKAPPLCNLYVSYLQHLGVETDQFASGTSTLTGLV